MADELLLRFEVPGPPRHVMAQWREAPPRALHGFRLVDESTDTLTFEQAYYDWPAKVLFVTTFGIGWLLRGLMGSLFRVTAHFGEERARTRVLLMGTAHPRTQAALHALAAEHGGPVTEPPPAATWPPGSPASWPRTPPR
jgi:hypothetical protein